MTPTVTRPEQLSGCTVRVKTPAGTIYTTINEHDGVPFEVFITAAKAGSEVCAVAEAIARLISYVLRMKPNTSPAERMDEVIHQLSGIGGSHHCGLGPNRVMSLPDGVAKALSDYANSNGDADKEYHVDREKLSASEFKAVHTGTWDKADALPGGDMCPECGHASLRHEAGCYNCADCGYSKC